MANYDYLFKIVIVGDVAVGKTVMSNCFKNGLYNDRHETTIGVDFNAKTIMASGQIIKLHIWDTAGQEKFYSLTKNYYKNVAGIILMYDITNRKSFSNLNRWIDDIKYHCGKHVSVVLVGNKVDKEVFRKVSFDEGVELANKINGIFFETSSKLSINVEAIFKSLSTMILEKISRKEAIASPEYGIKIGTVTEINLDIEKKNCCTIQ